MFCAVPLGLFLWSEWSIFVKHILPGYKIDKTIMVLDWVNIHTHRPGKGINIVDPCLGDIYMPEVGRIYFSEGIHPLYIGGDAEARLAEIEWAAAERRIVAVGEAGLDRNSPTPLPVQKEWFTRQAEIAGRYGLPLIIHCVRAFPELISVYNRCSCPDKWIIHGFNNRDEILYDLLRHGFYISAGRHAMNEESNIFRLLPEIPVERLLVETDDSAFSIDEVYRKIADRRGEKPEELKRSIYDNFKRLFPV